MKRLHYDFIRYSFRNEDDETLDELFKIASVVMLSPFV